MSYFVTGSMGCIGAWVMSHLVKRGEAVISFDISNDRSRLNMLLTPEEQAQITFIKGDLTHAQQVSDTILEQGVQHIIHMAALQVPFCRANPVLGAQVNVVGHLNIFEAARKANLKHVTYASSIAVYGSADQYLIEPVPHDALQNPSTLYGGFKACNEQNARVYFKDYGVSSTALRPYTVYGIGRDQGMTSDPTKAMLAAARGENYRIAYGGVGQMQLASDVALQFIACADQASEGAHVFNMGGEMVSMERVVELIQAVVPSVEITFEPTQLPFPRGFDDTALRQHAQMVYETPLNEGIQQTIEEFRQLSARGLI